MIVDKELFQEKSSQLSHKNGLELEMTSHNKKNTRKTFKANLKTKQFVTLAKQPFCVLYRIELVKDTIEIPSGLINNNDTL